MKNALTNIFMFSEFSKNGSMRIVTKNPLIDVRKVLLKTVSNEQRLEFLKHPISSTHGGWDVKSVIIFLNGSIQSEAVLDQISTGIIHMDIDNEMIAKTASNEMLANRRR